MPTTTPLTDRLKAEAVARGFTLAGVAPAADADGLDRYADWLANGYHGDMDYLRRTAPARRHPDSILPGVRSVLMLGLEYAAGSGPEAGGSQDHSELPPATRPLPTGRVAKYAQGPDYHRDIWDRMNELSAWLEAEVPGCAAAAVADTAPLLERDFARRAGLGWVGKNTMLINPRRGSYFMLGAVLTTLDLPADAPFAGSHCGTCTACLDACPTAAFPTPFVLDARRCLSYLTIELKGPMPEDLRPLVGDRLFGCDVCQDVCPWNRKGGGPGLPHDPRLESLDPAELLGMDAAAFRRRFKPTALWRPRRAGLLRNAAVVLGNVGDARAVPALERALDDEEDAVREAAAWALARIRQRTTV